MQLDQAFNRTCRERADLLTYMKRIDSQLLDLKVSTQDMEDRI